MFFWRMVEQPSSEGLIRTARAERIVSRILRHPGLPDPVTL
jgi:hypothetical protein